MVEPEDMQKTVDREEQKLLLRVASVNDDISQVEYITLF